MQDLHEAPVVSALTSLCTASLQLKPIQGLQREVAALSRGKQGGPHGQMQLHLKRHTGRVQMESELYTLLQNGRLQTFAMPEEAITAQHLAAQTVLNAGELYALLRCQMSLSCVKTGSCNANMLRTRRITAVRV